MKVRFRSRALNDVKVIIDHFEDVSPSSSGAILDDIDRSITLLKDYPHLGARVSGHPLRRLVTRKYKFKIAYEVTPDAIVIFGIFRFQDRKM